MAAAEIRPDWTIGTLNLTSGSVEFTTNDSMLQTAAIQPGDEIITASGLVLIIASITGQNSGTLMEPCPAGAAGSGQPLRIRFQPDGSRYNGATADLVQLLGSGNVYEFAGLQGVANGVPVFTGAGTMEVQGKDTFVIPDPNGNLAELAGLALAANKVLTTDDNGELTQSDITAAARVLLKLAGTAAGNKLPYFNGADSAALTDITAAARVLLKLAGTAASDQLPYFTGEDGAGLTPLTAFARSILDDANGLEMWETMGGLASSAASGFLILPNGFIFQWGAFWTGTAGTVPFPIAFPNGCRAIVATKGQAAMTPDNTYDNIQIGTYTTAGFEIAGRRVTGSSVVKANVTVTWIAIGH